jgi:phosphate transport system substrate-binding protein
VRTSRLALALVLLGALALGAAACGSSSNSGSGGSGGGGANLGGSINGAGATFPQPVYQEWAAQFKDKYGTTVNYQGIGSGGGIAQFTAGTVDFGATDAAMKPEEKAAAEKKGTPVHIPTVLGAVTVSYKVDGVDTGLKLDGPTIANIFLGKVKSWDDPSIKALNAGANLPGTAITVCHRNDESGTTKNFTQFLADYSPEWANGPGVDKSVKWPTGTGAKGNDGVAACVKQSDGSVGYVEQAFALANNFSVATVKNKAGQFVAPDLPSTSAAAEGIKIPANLEISTIDSANPKAYPITALTFLLAWQDQCKAGISPAKAKLVKAWLQYGESGGQEVAPSLKYAPLPQALNTKAKAKVDTLVCNGKPIDTGVST